MDLNEQYAALRGQSSDELMKTLLQMTAAQKQTGELNETKMEEIYRMLSPFLSESQRARMQEIIARLNTPNEPN